MKVQVSGKDVFASAWFSAALICAMCLHVTTANAYLTSTNVEDVACVNATQNIGVDSTKCIDPVLTCVPPDWFPVLADDASADTYETYNTFGPYKRWNKTEYAVDQYTHWEHIWYSQEDVPYGPALPEVGHQWHEFAGSTLVRKSTCDMYSTWSWPS